jgi:voltage-gated potassium channel
MRIGPVITVYAAILLLVVIFGTAFSYALGATNFNIPISNPLTALYFTIITISTVGYGDIYPVTAAGRIFTMILVLAGISTFIGAVTAISSDFMSKNVAKLSGRISGLERRTLSRHHVLIGTDFINQDIADKFRRERENFIILSADKTTADRYVDDGLRAFVADPTSETDMRKFEMHRARSIIIDLNENSLTVYALLIVRKLAPNVLTIVVAQNSEIAERVSDLGLKKNERVINVSSHLAGEIVRSLK